MPKAAATVNFTKWVTRAYTQPSEIFADMAGVLAEGDVGTGAFTGEVLSRVVEP